MLHYLCVAYAEPITPSALKELLAPYQSSEGGLPQGDVELDWVLKVRSFRPPLSTSTRLDLLVADDHLSFHLNSTQSCTRPAES